MKCFTFFIENYSRYHLPNLVKMCIFIKKFHYKEKHMFGIEPNLDRKSVVIIPEMSPYMDVLDAKLFPDTFRYYGIQA